MTPQVVIARAKLAIHGVRFLSMLMKNVEQPDMGLLLNVLRQVLTRQKDGVSTLHEVDEILRECRRVSLAGPRNI